MPMQSQSFIRPETLTQLRWIGIYGQFVAVVIAWLSLPISLPFLYIFLVIGIWAMVNLSQYMILRSQLRVNNDVLYYGLLIDFLEIMLIVFFSGGMSNPFAIFLLVPALLGAAFVTDRQFLSLVSLSAAGVVFLYFLSVPIIYAGQIVILPDYLLVAFTGAVLTALVFLSIFIRRISQEYFYMAQAMSAVELALQREQRISSLGALVAAFAHELGTPLATIRLTANDLLEKKLDKDTQDDVQLIADEVRNCNKLLHDMGDLGKRDLHMEHVPFIALVEEAAKPHRGRGKDIVIAIAPESHAQPIVERAPQIIHALRNIIQNAVDFAQNQVNICLRVDERALLVEIFDDGEGFSSDVLARLGDPFLHRRDVIGRENYTGMGLGVFISKTMLENSGAQISFANRPSSQGTGAIVRIRWQVEALTSPAAKPSSLGENPKNDYYD